MKEVSCEQWDQSQRSAREKKAQGNGSTCAIGRTMYVADMLKLPALLTRHPTEVFSCEQHWDQSQRSAREKEAQGNGKT